MVVSSSATANSRQPPRGFTRPTHKECRAHAVRARLRLACTALLMGLNACGVASGASAQAQGPGISQTPTSGRLLLGPGKAAVDAQVLDLATGKQLDLPRSVRGKSLDIRDDTWSWSRATRELIREDGAERVDILAWPSLALNASFKLATETRANEEARLLLLRMSHDGKYLAAIEYARGSSRKPRVLIFDRQGTILLAGPYQDQTSGGGGFDWLPDGRLMYFDKGDLKIHDLAQGLSSVVPVQYPVAVRAGQEALAISPDGRSVVIQKPTPVRNSRGEPLEVSVLFRVGIDGGAAEVVAHPSQERVDDPVRMVMMDLSWSADGQWLAFAARVGDDRYGSGLGVGGCPYVYAVPAASRVPAQINGIGDLEKVIRAPLSGAGREPVVTCGQLRWF